MQKLAKLNCMIYYYLCCRNAKLSVILCQDVKWGRKSERTEKVLIEQLIKKFFASRCFETFVRNFLEFFEMNKHWSILVFESVLYKIIRNTDVTTNKELICH